MTSIIQSYYLRNNLNHIEELIMKVTNYAWSEMTLFEQGELREQAAAKLSALTAELETVKRERDAAIALLSKMAKEEPCDNDGRGCPCVEMAYEFVAALKAGKA